MGAWGLGEISDAKDGLLARYAGAFPDEASWRLYADVRVRRGEY